jgi:hypothetical protein
VLLAVVYLLVRRVVRLIASSCDELMNAEVEVVVLRHQLTVLKRQLGRPRLRRRDWLFMAAISRTLPRARWSSFVVSPQTLLRWHRELVRRTWTYSRGSAAGRPPIAGEVESSSCGWEGRTHGGDDYGHGASWPSWASASRRPRSARCFEPTGSVRLPGETVPPGASSSGPRRG